MESESCVNSLVVMAKAPQPGKVKTRLQPLLGRVGATRLYRELLSDSLSRLSGSRHYARYLSCAPDIRQAAFLYFRRHQQWHLQRQPAGDLGMRMAQIISRQLRRYDAVIVVGSDLVDLGSEQVEWGFNVLADGADLVIGTTRDGGYGMIGMTRLHAGLFRGMPWSTTRVADITLARARRKQLQTSVLTGLQDIDTPVDYRLWLADKTRENTGFRNAIP